MTHFSGFRGSWKDRGSFAGRWGCPLLFGTKQLSERLLYEIVGGERRCHRSQERQCRTKRPMQRRQMVSNQGDYCGMQKVKAVACITEQNEGARFQELGPARTQRQAINNGCERGRKKSGGNQGTGNSVGEEYQRQDDGDPEQHERSG
jgi:hypothetical protein